MTAESSVPMDQPGSREPGHGLVTGPELSARLKLLLRFEDGDTNGMMDYIGAAALFVFIIVVLFLLRRSDQRRNRES